jgi:6,7-dimethyl-8-ribityllumazine synthase
MSKKAPSTRRTAVPAQSKTKSKARSAARPPHVAIIVSRYNRSVTDALLAGSLAEADRLGAEASVYDAAGAFEILGTAAAAAESGRFDGILSLGCIIKGETKHDDYLAHAVTSGLGNLSVATGIPVSLGVLTVNTQQQALDRAGGKHGNKGAEAMTALLDMIGICRAIRAGTSAPQLSGKPDKLKR